MAFVPPVYANLGKQYKDLYKKKYDFDHQVKVINKTDFGLTLTTTGTIKKDSISGAAKGEYKDKRFGDAEAEVDTQSGKVYGKANFLNFLKNAKFTLGGGFDPSSKDKLVKESWSVKAEAEYRKDSFALSGSALVGTLGGQPAEVVEGAAVVGVDGLSVGGQVKLRLDIDQNLDDYNVGAQYERPNFTAALLTEKKGDIINFSWYHKVSDRYQLGVELVSNELDETPNARKRQLTLASQYQVDAATVTKARVNNFGELGAVIEHRLSNPAVLIGAAAQFKAAGLSGIKADKFGLTISVGDF